MNIREALLKEHSKRNTMAIAGYIGNDAVKMRELMKVFEEKDHRLCQRAAWPLMYIAESHPALIYPHMEALTNLLDNPMHQAIKRNVMRVFQNLDIPEELMGKVADHGFRYLTDVNEKPAVKAFAMTVLYKIALKEPDLKHELKLLIEDMIPYGAPAIKSRGTKILKALEKS